MAETIITTREVLNRYEKLYFQPRQKSRNFCDPTSSNHHNLGMLHGKNFFFSTISQLRLVGSHNTNFGAVARGALELDALPFGRCHFLSDPCVFGYIF